jgi:hypothetical protein
MTILEELLSEIKTVNIVEKLKMICDRIQKEENEKFTHPKELVPKGPNNFLVVEVPGRNIKEIAYLVLERDMPVSSQSYNAVLYTYMLPKLDYTKPDSFPPPKRQQTWTINETEPQKVLKAFARTIKFLKGE